MAKHVVISAVKTTKMCYPKTVFCVYLGLDGKQLNYVSGYWIFSNGHERFMEIRIVMECITKEGRMAKTCEIKETENTPEIMVDGHEIKDVISYSIEHRGEVPELVVRIAITDELQLRI